MTSPRTLHDTGSPSEASSSAWGALHSDEATQSSGGKRSAVSGSEKRNRSAHEQENGRDVGQMGIAVLILLGVIASVVMLLLGSAVAMKVALLVLLWAAVLGMFLVARYRRQAQDSYGRMTERERQHQAELRRLTAASRDQSEQNDSDSRSSGSQRPSHRAVDASGLSRSDVEMLREIRAEISQIRAQLEELSGRDFTYEPAALRAEARRIMEVEARAHAASQATSDSGESGVDSDDNFDFTQSSFGAPSADAIAGRLGSEPVAGYPNEQLRNIVAEQKTTDAGTASKVAAPAKHDVGVEKPSTLQANEPAQSVAGSRASNSRDPHPEGSHNEGADSGDWNDRTFNTDSFQAVNWDKGGDDNVRRGRRRQDAVSYTHLTLPTICSV